MYGPIADFGYWKPNRRRSLAAHRNPGLEIVYIAGGCLRWHVEDRGQDVFPGSVFYTFGWETHGSVLPVEPGCELYYMILRTTLARGRPLRFDARLGLTDAETRRLAAHLVSRSRRCWPATPRLAYVLPELVGELQAAAPNRSAALALARLAVLELGRSVGRTTPRPQPLDASQRVRHFLTALADHCEQPWDLPAMAAACGMGRTRFATFVRQQTGDTPSLLLNRARVRRAQHLLTSTEWSITRIALACGYNSSQYFATVFRLYAGVAPGEYRSTAATGQRRLRR